jgi:cysteine protease ATG4
MTDAPILSLFADDQKAPFSIHRFVSRGAAVCGKYPGEWFGPSATARCIQDLVKEHKEAGLRVYVSGDGADVYEDNLKEIARDGDGVFQPTLILVGTRLGIDKITPVYWEALKSSLQMKQSIGIAGSVLYPFPFLSLRYKIIKLTPPQAAAPLPLTTSLAPNPPPSFTSTHTPRAPSSPTTHRLTHTHTRRYHRVTRVDCDESTLGRWIRRC